MYYSDEDYDNYDSGNDFYDSSDNEFDDDLDDHYDTFYDDKFYEEELELFEKWQDISLEDFKSAFNGNKMLQIKIRTQLDLLFQQYDRHKKLNDKLVLHSEHWADISKSISASSRGISSFRKLSGRRSHMEEFFWNDKDKYFYPASFDDTYIPRVSDFKHKSLKEDILSEDQLSFHVWFNLRFRKMVIYNDLDDKFISVHDVYKEHQFQLKMKKVELKKEQQKGKKKKRSGRKKIENVIISSSGGGFKDFSNLDGVLPSCSPDNGEENFTYKISSIKKQSSDSLPPTYYDNNILSPTEAVMPVVSLSSETPCIGGVISTIHDNTGVFIQQQQQHVEEAHLTYDAVDKTASEEASSISVSNHHILKKVGVSASLCYSDDNISFAADHNLDGVLPSCPSPDNGSLNLTKGFTITYKKQSSVSSVPFCDRAFLITQQQQISNENNDSLGLGKKGKGRSRPGKKERAALKEVKSAGL